MYPHNQNIQFQLSHHGPCIHHLTATACPSCTFNIAVSSQISSTFLYYGHNSQSASFFQTYQWNKVIIDMNFGDTRTKTAFYECCTCHRKSTTAIGLAILSHHQGPWICSISSSVEIIIVFLNDRRGLISFIYFVNYFCVLMSIHSVFSCFTYY